MKARSSVIEIIFNIPRFYDLISGLLFYLQLQKLEFVQRSNFKTKKIKFEICLFYWGIKQIDKMSILETILWRLIENAKLYCKIFR